MVKDITIELQKIIPQEYCGDDGSKIVYLCPLEPKDTSMFQGSIEIEKKEDIVEIVVPISEDGFLCPSASSPLKIWSWYPVSWEREIDPLGKRTVYLTVKAGDPYGDCANCYCHSIRVKGHRIGLNPHVTNQSFLYAYRIQIPPGSIPLSGEIEDYWMTKTVEHRIINTTTPSVVPGEQIILLWNFFINKKYSQVIAGVSWFNSPMCTGGFVKAKKEGNIPTELQWEIEVEGKIYTVTPTDFADYQIGDFVFLIKTDEEARTYDRRQSYQSEVTSGSPGEVETDSNQICSEINAVRQNLGRSPLMLVQSLNDAAYAYAENMSKNNFLNHTGLDGSTPYRRAQIKHYFDDPLVTEGALVSVGENIALNNKSDLSIVVQQWIDSPPHYANLLNPDWEDTGIGISNERNGIRHYVQMFGVKNEEAGGDSNTEESEMRVAPIYFYGGAFHPNPSVYETKDFGMNTNFTKAFELCYHDGVITSINGNETANVDVTIKKGIGVEETITFNNVEIFYHCFDSSTTDQGHTAFTIGDEVIVLNETTDGLSISASDLSIIGFKNELKRCRKCMVMIGIFNWDASFAKYYLWDLAANTELPVLDDEGNVISDPTTTEINNYMNVLGLATVNVENFRTNPNLNDSDDRGDRYVVSDDPYCWGLSILESPLYVQSNTYDMDGNLYYNVFTASYVGEYARARNWTTDIHNYSGWGRNINYTDGVSSCFVMHQTEDSDSKATEYNSEGAAIKMESQIKTTHEIHTPYGVIPIEDPDVDYYNCFKKASRGGWYSYWDLDSYEYRRLASVKTYVKSAVGNKSFLNLFCMPVQELIYSADGEDPLFGTQIINYSYVVIVGAKYFENPSTLPADIPSSEIIAMGRNTQLENFIKEKLTVYTVDGGGYLSLTCSLYE